MSIKTWFKHGINCHMKDGFSNALDIGGPYIYGVFWLLEETLGLQNLNRDSKINIIRINESSLTKLLRTNVRRLPEIFGNLSDTLRVSFRKVPERFPKGSGRFPKGSRKVPEASRNIWEITLPKSLIYMENQIFSDRERIRERREQEREQEQTDVSDLDDVIFECKYFTVRREDYQTWLNAYPQVNVKAEFPKMYAWLDSNPSRLKKNYKRFITNWLGRCSPDLTYVAKKNIRQEKKEVLKSAGIDASKVSENISDSEAKRILDNVGNIANGMSMDNALNQKKKGATHGNDKKTK